MAFEWRQITLPPYITAWANSLNPFLCTNLREEPQIYWRPNMITRSAVKITQGDLTLYATSFKVEHLLEKDFYKIEKLDTSESSSGFQRVLDKARAKRLANYLLDGWKDGDAFLPTSILLATDKPIPFDAEKKEIKIDLEQIKSFNVVDGQHRIEGLIQAAKDNPEIKEFEIPTNIAEDLDEISQMCHFLIVNTTQKSVDKSVEQQILSRLSSMIDIEAHITEMDSKASLKGRGSRGTHNYKLSQ